MDLDRPKPQNAELLNNVPVDSAVTEAAVAAFRRSYLVGGLTEEQVRAMLVFGRFRRFTAQERMVRADEPSNDLLVILDGRASIISKEGEKLGEAQQGMIVGEIALCDAGPRTADVIAIGLVDAVVLPAKDLRAHLAQNREVGFLVLANLAKTLANRLRLTNQKLDTLADKATDHWDRAL